MTSASTLFRSLIIYCVCIPLAVILGYLMANPFDLATFGVMGVLFFLLLTPLLLKWHHTWLIASWNMSMVLFLTRLLKPAQAVWHGLTNIFM